ncbi:MAG: hypothetical protein L3J39_09805 [Verrucomicrobiales bacterium]|nr:hypothetical protein [Verrucomicrobiales bacterium]
MQHTKFDRWLWRKFVHINQIYFNTMPDSFPHGLELMESDAESGARYRYRATTRSEHAAQELCEIFLAENITYTARIQNRDTVFARFVGDANRSVTMLVVWIGLFFVSVLFIFSGATQTLSAL